MMRQAAVLLAVLALSIAAAPETRMPVVTAYPEAARGPVSDVYFGTIVPDPYRSLEALDDPATRNWKRDETALSRRYLSTLPGRVVIQNGLLRLLDFSSRGFPVQRGKVWLQGHYDREHGRVLNVCRSVNGPCRVLIDAKVIERDGRTQIAGYAYATDGRYVAYGTTQGGSDAQTWRVRSVATGRDLADEVRGAKFWTPLWDGHAGFYWEGYRRRGNADVGPYSIFYHRLGTEGSRDRLVFAPPRGRQWYSAIQFTDDGRYVLVNAGTAAGSGSFWRHRNEPDSVLRPLFAVGNASYDVFANDGPILYASTTNGAPRGRVVWTDVRDEGHPLHTIVPESAATIAEVVMVGERFYINEVRDAQSQIRIFDRLGHPRGVIALPGRGEASFGPVRRYANRVLLRYDSFTERGLLMSYNTSNARVRTFFRNQMPFDRRTFVTEQFFARSSDGTRVPYFVTHRKDMPLDQSTPTILYGYGAFGISQLPAFNDLCVLWVAHGGAYAVANGRGGGEYGETWHLAATRTHKQRSFDDFSAVARALVARRITSPDRLGIYGISGGGLLVGAAEVEHPELYGAVAAESGLYDMLRYQRFPGESAWIPEDGSSDVSAAEFQALAAYSPYHNVRDGVRYPATLVLAEAEDDRVDPAHSYKFVAALQHAQASPAPILLDLTLGGGHGDERLAIVNRRETDILAFFGSALGLDWRS